MQRKNYLGVTIHPDLLAKLNHIVRQRNREGVYPKCTKTSVTSDALRLYLDSGNTQTCVSKTRVSEHK